MKKIINLTLLLAAGLILGSNLNSMDDDDLQIKIQEIQLAREEKKEKDHLDSLNGMVELQLRSREKREAEAKLKKLDGTYMREMSQEEITGVLENIEISLKDSLLKQESAKRP